MGTDVSEVTDPLPSPHDIKVHQLMCKELFKLVYGVSNIFPEIEASRPRCSSGIETLVLLNNAIDKAKLLLQNCSESSKLYLALTGDAILSRCKKSRNLLVQSLSQMQNMVPVLLASKISQVVSDLRNVSFRLDPSDEEAGKVLRDLLHQYGSTRDSIKETAFEAIRFSTLRLGINSQTALLIEKRSIKKLLDQVGENDTTGKRKILSLFLSLLNKYGKLIVKEPKVTSFPSSLEVESRVSSGPDHAQINTLSIPAVPEEFRCPLSLRLMYDPVVIASGQTFERMWIQKWFDEGHDTCPKTKNKLPHLSLTPNTAMKDLITKWCTANKISISDPSFPEVLQRLETSSSSIASLSYSMNHLSLPIDYSNLSIGSSDARQGSDSSYSKINNGSSMTSTDTDDIHRFQTSPDTHEADMKILFELDSLPWELRCKVVRDIKISENHEHRNCNSVSCKNVVQTILNFLKDAHDFCDTEAQKTGCLLLSSFLNNCRSSVVYLEEDAYGLLTAFLDTEVVEEALSVLEVLSSHGDSNHKFFETSGALFCILRILDKEIEGLQELALGILYNLSANSSMRSFVVASEFIPKLISYLEDTALAGYSIVILENFCYNEDARIIITETDGCIASIIKLLESDRHDEQEHAVAVLLSLCSQRVQYCRLVMDEGIIPFLVAVSKSGNDKGKVMATELLRLLREEIKDTEEFSESDIGNSRNSGNHSTTTQRKSHRNKATGILKKLSVFTKHSSVAAKTKS